MRPEGEENEAGFEELIMRRICVGTRSPHKKYGKGIVCGEFQRSWDFAGGLKKRVSRSSERPGVPRGRHGRRAQELGPATTTTPGRPWTRCLQRRPGPRRDARPRERAAASRGGGLAEGARRVLALPGGAAELGAAAGGGLARGDGARGRTQDGGAAGRRLRQASAPTGAADPREERQRHGG